MKFRILFCLICILLPYLTAQASEPVVIPGQFKYFTTDRLGYVYVITQKNDIQKFSRQGKKIAEANFKVLGDASFIDATNPLEIYVFYRDQNRLVYFDNLLNYRGETDLYKSIGVNNITAVCRSYDNGFWFFDPDQYKLIKSDKSGNRLAESVNLAGLADTVIQPRMLLDDGKNVYVQSSSNRLLVFDILGNYSKTIVFGKFNAFQSRNPDILFATDTALILYNQQTFEKTSVTRDKLLSLPRPLMNIRLEENSLYILETGSVFILDNE